MKTTLLRVTTVLVLLLVAGPVQAERKNPLEGQPAIRHFFELRKGRFELGPSFAFSLNRALRQAITFGLKLEYHLSDMFSVGADFGYGIGVDTGLTTELERQYADDQGTFKQLRDRFSDIQLAGDIRFAFTPISGKLGIFAKLFVWYDLYAFAAVALVNTTNKYEGDSLDRKPDIATQDALSSGFRVGPAFGFGMHIFFTRFFSMGLEIKNLIYLDNESGGDMTRGISDKELAMGVGTILYDGDDRQFEGHWFFGMNFTFFLPTEPELSR